MNRKAILGALGVSLLLMLQGSISRPISSTSVAVKPNSLLVMSGSPSILPNEQVENGNTQFGFNLFTTIVEQNQNQNVFISPTSVAIALGMLYNGAEGETQAAMAEALALEGVGNEAINATYQNLQKTLTTADPKVELAIANSLWVNQNVNLNSQFLDNTRQYYQAEVSNLDFTNSQAKDTINQWVANQTNDKITQIVDRIKPEDVIFLINAIYFKGNWTNAFDRELTSEKPFTLADGSSVSHPLMSQRGRFRYYESDRIQAVSIPYGEGGMSMYIFLPSEDSSLSAFYQQLSVDNWNKWLSEFQFKEGAIEIPRFDLEYGIELNDTLKALGLSPIFDRASANFSAMTDESVAVDQIKHKTFVEVNEEGTEAAASTSVGVGITSANPVQPFQMIVDRPFFCAIRDENTGTLVFMGSIVDPT